MNGESESEFDASDVRRGAHPVLKLTFVLLGILGLWALVSGWLLIRGSEPSPRAEKETSWHQEPTGDEAMTQAMEAWRAFVESPDLDTLIEHVRDPDRVGPMMRNYYESSRHPRPTMSRSSSGRVIEQGGQRMIVFEVEDYGGRRYPVAMGWTGRRFAVDWESLSAYGTMDWPQLIEEKPVEAQVMRVYLGAIAPELTPPQSVVGPRQFVRMEHRDFPESLPLALKPELVQEVLRLVEGRRVPVTVEVRWNPEFEHFELQRLLGLSWSLQR